MSELGGVLNGDFAEPLLKGDEGMRGEEEAED